MFRTFRPQEFAAAEPEPPQKRQKSNGAAAVPPYEETLLQDLQRRIESKKSELDKDKLDEDEMKELAAAVLRDHDIMYSILRQKVKREARIQWLLGLHQEPADATLEQEPDDDSDDDPDTYLCGECGCTHPWTQQPCIPDTCEDTDGEEGTGCCEHCESEHCGGEHCEGSQGQDTDEDMALVDEPEPEEVTCPECGKKSDGLAQCPCPCSDSDDSDDCDETNE